MVTFWRFLGSAFPASRVQHITDLHSKFALGPHMCGSMVDIQSAIADIRRGKKKRETGRKYRPICPHPAMQGGHKWWGHAGLCHWLAACCIRYKSRGWSLLSTIISAMPMFYITQNDLLFTFRSNCAFLKPFSAYRPSV